MNPTRKTATNWLSAIGYRLILGVLVSVFALHAHSACKYFDEFVDNKNGTVTDSRNGLVWQVCADGYDWNGRGCTGKKIERNWYSAMEAAKSNRFLNKSDWRLPSKQEFQTVLGTGSDCRNNDSTRSEFAVSTMLTEGLNSVGGYPSKFWSVSAYSEDVENAWAVDLVNGNFVDFVRDYELQVRFVRATTTASKDSILEFNREYASLKKYKAATMSKENQLNQKNAEWTENDKQLRATRGAYFAGQERDRVANACNNFYQGKSIGFKPAGWSYFGATLDAVVLGKGNGNVSIKIVDRHFTDLYGKTLEMSCTSDQLQ